MKKTAFFCFALLLSFFSTNAQTTMVFEDWHRSTGSQAFTEKVTIQTDPYGSVYVAGATESVQGNLDIQITKYDRRGNLLWTDQYAGLGNGDDAAYALIVDSRCNAYLTGKTYTSTVDSFDAVTIHYDSSGTRQWVAVFGGTSGQDDWGTGIALDATGVYVGGNSIQNGTGKDFLGLKYDFNGSLTWSNTYDGFLLEDYCKGIAIASGSVTLGGTFTTNGLNKDIALVRLQASNGGFVSRVTSSGTQPGFDEFGELAADGSGNVYITGSVTNAGTGRDLLAKKYNASLGVVWTRTYTNSGNQSQAGNSIAFDGAGNAYVAGLSDSTGQSANFVALKFDLAGNLQWANIWNDSANGADTANAIAVDNAGNVVVTGSAWNGFSTDIQTIKYDNNGSVIWETAFNDKYNFADHAMDLALDNAGNVFVGGQMGKPGNLNSNLVIRYFQTAIVVPLDPEPLSSSLRYIENRDQLIGTNGQMVQDVRFYSQQTTPNVYFMNDTLVHVFSNVDSDSNTVDTLHRINMTFGSNQHQLLPIGRESYHGNFYLAHIPQGRPLVPLYKHLYLEEVYDHVDVNYTSNGTGPKYQFIIKPNGIASSITMEYSGQDSIYVDAFGNLIVQAAIDRLSHPRPKAYEMDLAGTMTLLPWQPVYLVNGNVVRFDQIGPYNTSMRLVIVEDNGASTNSSTAIGNLEWSTFFGGTGNDWILDMTQSPQGQLFVGGKTESTNFDIILGPSYVTNMPFGSQDGFVAGFDQNEVLEWFTYLGGSSNDAVQGLAFNEVATANRLAFVGYLESSDFATQPVSNPQNGSYYKATSGGAKDVWMGRLEETSGIMKFGAYLGGGGHDEARSVGCDNLGNVYITGTTQSGITQSNACQATTGSQFPLCDPGNGAYFQSSYHGAQDIFLVKLDLNNFLKWSTFFGSDATDEVFELNIADNHNITFNSSDQTILICGRTAKQSSGSNACNGVVPATEFPLCDQTGSFFQAGTGAFISRFSQNGNLLWSSNFNNIREFQSVTSSNGNFYAVGIIPNNSIAVGVSSNCSPMAGSDIPICDAGGGFSQAGTGAQLYIAKFGKGSNNLVWSTLYGTNAMIDFSGSHYVPGVYCEPYTKYIDAVASEDDHLFVLGVSIEEFDCYLDPTYSNWYSQTDNFSFTANPLTEQSADAFLLGMDPNQDRKWASLFGGGGSGFRFYNHPFLNEFSSAAILRDKTLYISGYAGGGGSSYPFPLVDQGQSPTGTTFYHNGIGTNMSNLNYDGFISKFNATQMLVTDATEAETDETPTMIFPNPTNHSFDIALPENVSACTVKVYDIAGKQVIEPTCYTVGGNSIDMTGIPAGIYLVQTVIKNRIHTTKLIKQ